ncbi:glycosyltransferase [Vibrio breoganii]|uniref:Glycosyltransferase n=1 Tax=Vibrio breoganii TaxID=553239 RepID=A0ABX1UGS3_9VIBR|nr:glycosyltransferase [Vibrio breoganii]NMO74824.1 glycosyltransferase family 4 protein [Vibrio breoganii]NMR71940.1 glycosyltransferase [Vibrio breoganii]PML84899.1 hypothetical protein BCT67_15600 [Vibrio breoganii]
MTKSIVIVQNSLKTTVIFRQDLIRLLCSKGAKVIVLAPNDCEESKSKLVSLGVLVEDIPSLDNKFSCLMKMNAKILKYRFKGCYFMTFFIVSYLFAIVPLRLFNTKLVLSIEGLGSVFTNNPLLCNILKVLISGKNIRRIFCNNDERALVGSPDDLVSGGIGVDLKEFNIVRKKRETLNLLYVGRLIRDKGILDVIEVFERLRRHGYSVRLNIVGSVYNNNPSSLTEVDIEFYQSKFGDDINFVGFTTNVSFWYDDSDVLLLPSKREGFPVCVMEASASGIPSVVYNVPGCRDAVSHGVNGLICKEKSIDSLFETTRYLIDTNLNISMKESSRNYAEQNFDVSSKSKLFANQILK